jgi:carboxylesterase type B
MASNLFLRNVFIYLQVMVFIAGGAYEQSSPFVPLYDATFIANYTNTVVVLIAYRLGALGFMVTDELNGNYG